MRRSNERDQTPIYAEVGQPVEKRIRLLTFCNRPDSLAFPADSAIAGVFENDTALGKLVAEAVRRGKITALARGLPFGDEGFYFGVSERGGSLAYAKRAELLRVIIAQHGKNRVECFHHTKHRCCVTLAELATVHRRVGVAHQIEDCRERLRRVEIVRKAAVELSLRI